MCLYRKSDKKKNFENFWSKLHEEKNKNKKKTLQFKFSSCLIVE